MPKANWKAARLKVLNLAGADECGLVTDRECPDGCKCRVWTPAVPCEKCGQIVCVWCAQQHRFKCEHAKGA